MQFEECLEDAKNKERAGNLVGAVSSYEQCYQLNPEHKEILLNLSRLYLMIAKPIQSMDVLKNSKNLTSDKDLLVQLSNTYMTLNQFDEAEKVLKQAITISPQSAILNNLGVVAIRRGKGEEAIDLFTESLRLDEKNVNTWFNIATYYESQSDLIKAKEVMEQALQKLNNKEIKEKYIQLLNQLGEPGKALDLIEKELMLDPSNLMFQVAKMRTLFFSRKYDACLSWIEEMQSIKDCPAKLTIEILETKEKCYFFKQLIPSSLEILDQLLLLSNGNPSYEFRKAYVHAVNKNFKEALLILKQLLSNKNLPAVFQQDALSLMKSIEIENWKSLVEYLFKETESKEMLANNFIYILETRGILLPDEGLQFLKNVVENYRDKNNGLDGQSGFLS